MLIKSKTQSASIFARETKYCAHTKILCMNDCTIFTRGNSKCVLTILFFRRLNNVASISEHDNLQLNGATIDTPDLDFLFRITLNENKIPLSSHKLPFDSTYI